jgi:hypothetical protein
MALLPWLAAERFRADLSGWDTASHPETAAVYVEGRLVRAPVRATDVSEGFVVYAVAAQTVQALLDEQRVPLRPVGLGLGRAAVAMFGARYRASDLGAYDEVGLGFLVAPRRDPLAMGLYYFELDATTRLACEAAKRLWGVVKSEEHVEVAFEPTRATWRLVRRASGREVLTVEFPRGGGGASTAIPVSIYSVLGGRLHRSRSTRTGRGERVRLAGRPVSFRLGDQAHNAHDPLWTALRRLRIPEAPTILCGWTERMSGQMAAPRPVASSAGPPPVD